MPPFQAEPVIGDMDVGEAGIGKRALTICAARRNDAEAIGNAVLDVQAMDVHAGNAAAVQTDLKGGAPGPVVIVTAAADEIAVPHDGRSAEIVIDLFLRIRRRERRADAGWRNRVRCP